MEIFFLSAFTVNSFNPLPLSILSHVNFRHYERGFNCTKNSSNLLTLFMFFLSLIHKKYVEQFSAFTFSSSIPGDYHRISIDFFPILISCVFHAKKLREIKPFLWMLRSLHDGDNSARMIITQINVGIPKLSFYNCTRF